VLNPPRLLLLSGQPGAGTSTVAQAISYVLTGAGVEVVLPEPAARMRDIEHGVGHILTSLGAECLGPDELSLLLDVDGIAELLAVHDALSTPGADVVVWDAGHAERLLRLRATVDSLPALAARLVTPSTIALGLDAKVVQDFTADLLAIRDALVLESTWNAVVVTPDRGVGAYVEEHRAASSLLGSSVDCTIVNRFPRAKDGWPRPWAKAMRQRATALALEGDQVTFLPWLQSDPSSLRNLQRLGTRIDVVGGGGRPRLPEIVAEPNGTFSLHLHLPRVAPDCVRVGRLDQALVVEVASLRRLVQLSPVLTRCRLVGAGFRGDVLIIRFERDEKQWSARSQGQSDE
jgi:anion-transporting  ArsA/GET3 family ATPase